MNVISVVAGEDAVPVRCVPAREVELVHPFDACRAGLRARGVDFWGAEVVASNPAVRLFTRPSGANSISLWEALLALLDEGGIGGRDAAWSADFLLQRATASAVEEGVRLQDPNIDVADAHVADVINSLSPKDHPHLAALSAEMLSGPPTARLIWSFDVLLDGVGVRPQSGIGRGRNRGRN